MIRIFIVLAIMIGAHAQQSGSFCLTLSKINYRHSPEDLGRLQNLANRKILSLDQLLAITAGQEDLEIFWNLREQGHLTNEEQHLLENAFVPLAVGEPSGSWWPAAWTDRHGHGLVVKVQPSHPLDRGGSCLTFLDPYTDRPFAAIEYDWQPMTLTIESLYITKPNRRRGFSQWIVRQVLHLHPQVQVIIANLDNDNTPQAGPIEKAIRETPAYKIRQRLGFTEVAIQPSPDHPDVLQLIAVRPSGADRASSDWPR